MIPRSSRNQSTLVPADEHDRLHPPRERAVERPQRQREGAGRGPVGGSGRTGVGAQIEHPAGAEGDLGPSRRPRSSGRRATPAGRRGCRRWAAHRASALATPQTPTESTTSGRIDRGMANASRTGSFQSLPSTRRKADVAADALVWSLTCNDAPDAPPEIVQATQLSTVPKHRSRSDRSPLLAEQPGQLRHRLVRCERPAVLDLWP